MTDPVMTKATTIELDRTEGELLDKGQEDIVVDLPYVDLVARLIRAEGVDADPDVERMSPALGLGVVVVQDIKALADSIDIGTPERKKVPEPANPPRTNLDRVLVWLRQEFRRLDPKSKIEVGKNRTAQGVHGTPHIGGDTYPLEARNPHPEDNSEISFSTTVKVGLIDTRAYRHPSFGNRLKFIGRGELPDVPPFNHLDIHGTFTVGLILKRAPKAEVIVKAVLRHELAKATAWDVAVGMAEFTNQDVRLVILPLVCFTADDEPPLALLRAVTLLRHHGIAVVAAAGNHGDLVDSDGNDNPTKAWRGFPAACVGATAVGATNSKGVFKAAFNPRDEANPWIALAGPGINVVSTSVKGKISYVRIKGIPLPDDPEPDFTGGAKWEGTSFATATVGGEIAAKLVENDGMSVFDVIDKLKAQPPHANGGIGGYDALKPPQPPAPQPAS